MPLSFSILRHDDRHDDPITRDQLEELARRRPDLGQFEILGSDTIFRTRLREGTKNKRRILLLVNGFLFLDGSGREELITWLLAVAGELNARVRDNAIQTYRSPTEKYLHEEDGETLRRYRKADARAKKDVQFMLRHPWLHKNLISLIVFPLFLLVCLLLIFTG